MENPYPNYEIIKYVPEKLNLWDRLFNRYKKVIIEEGKETWNEQSAYHGVRFGEVHSFQRHFVKYKIIDRVTGSETIKKEYLN